MKHFSEELIRARKLRGMTQSQLADALHMSRQAISHWENGRTLPDAEMLVKVSGVLQYDFVNFCPLEEGKAAEAQEPAPLNDAEVGSAKVSEQETPAAPRAAEAEAPAAPHAAPPTNGRKRRVMIASVLIAVVFIAVLTAGAFFIGRGMRDVKQPGLVVMPQAKTIQPAKEPELGEGDFWLYNYDIINECEIPVIINRTILIYYLQDGSEYLTHEFTQAQLQSFWGTNVLKTSDCRMYSGAELATLALGRILLTVEGVDANGNPVSGSAEIICEAPEN